MKKLILIMLLAACISADAAVYERPDYEVNDHLPQLDIPQAQPEQQNDVVKLVDARLMQILDALNQSIQSGSCWMDGKAWSQGAVTRNNGHQVTCGKDADNWPKWQRVK